jgi:hypothetical protein
LADIYLARSEKYKAISTLEKGLEIKQSAIRHGLRWSMSFDDPIFEDLWGEPHFVALRQELDAILTEEHLKILQLICFNNPVPDDWQPMPETCEGVVEKRGF